MIALRRGVADEDNVAVAEHPVVPQPAGQQERGLIGRSVPLDEPPELGIIPLEELRHAGLHGPVGVGSARGEGLRLVCEHGLHAVIGLYRHGRRVAEEVRRRNLDIAPLDAVMYRLAAQRVPELSVLERPRRVQNHIHDIDRHGIGQQGDVARNGPVVRPDREPFVVGRADLLPLLVAVVRPAPAVPRNGERADIVAESQVQFDFGFARRVPDRLGRRIADDPHAVESIQFVEHAALEPVHDVALAVHLGGDIEVLAACLDTHVPRPRILGRRRRRRAPSSSPPQAAADDRHPSSRK